MTNRMTNRLLIVLMSALAIGLGLCPATNKMDLNLVKAAALFFRGIVSRL